MITNNKSEGNWIENEKSITTDLIRFEKILYELASQREFAIQELGKVKEYPILLLTPKKSTDGPNLLIAAVFHGEEPAGGWGILRFLQEVPENIIASSNLSFLPIVNPTGFRNGRRINDWGENPNRGFIHSDPEQSIPSREGHILVEHLASIKLLAKDGFISLHEDIEMEKFYIYTFENAEVPGAFSETLRNEEQKYFRAYPDGILEGGLVSNGIIFRYCDGSFEDLLFHEGIPRTACIETPGLLHIDSRIEANVGIITAFVNFAISTNT
jgi:predicted deacylase